MSRKEEKWIKRLEILGASAAVIVIVSAVGTFLLDSITMQLMALAVGCGSIVPALPAYAAGPSRESVPYADSYASYQWAFLNTGELRLVPSHTAAVDAAIGAITGSPALSADGTVRSLEGIDMNIVPAWKKYDAKSGKRQVIVALIDTGVDITHPELSGSIWTNTGEIPDAK